MLHVLGLPTDINSSFLRGPALAPPRIRLMHTQGSANASAEDGTLISWPGVLTDLGDLTLDSANPEYVHQRIREAARAHLRQGGRLICLGGDHSISFPVIDEHAVVHPGLHVLHFDAHGDLYQDFDGNRYSHASPFARLMETGRIASLTQIGIRTLTAHQREQSARYGVRTVEMKDFHSGTLPSLDGPLYISVDLDVLDPGFAPGVSHHEPGGMSTRELLQCIQQVAVPIAGADLVEYNPARDVHDMTAMVGYKVLKELAAAMLRHPIIH